MKLEKNVPEVQMRGVEQVTDFSINVSAQAFSILSSGLYKNPIRAIIRELSTNAVDAHQEAGTEDKPFDVEFPTQFNPVFRIRDYGIGLSKKDVMGLYSTYFSSTKTDSNEQIGALGLGSKSPLGYTNSFSVVSYFNGVKYNFSVFIGENGFPNIAVTGEKKTKEHNGLEIIIPVKEDRYYMHKWYDNAKSIYKYFDVVPNIQGAEIEVVKPTYSREIGKIKVCKNSHYDKSSNVVQGNIAYPLSLTECDLPDGVYQLLNQLSIDVYVDIGDVSFLPNREELSYDDKTKKVIRDSSEKFVEELAKDVISSIKKIRTINDLFEVYKDINDNYRPLVKANDDVLKEFKLKFARWQDVLYFDENYWGWSLNYRVNKITEKTEKRFDRVVHYSSGRRAKNRTHSSSDKLNFWINDTKRSVLMKFGKYAPHKTDNILIQGFDDLDKTVKYLKRTFKITNEQIRFVSDIAIPKTVPKKKLGIHVNRLRLVSYSHSYYAEKNWRWERGLKVDHIDNNASRMIWVEQKNHQAVGYMNETKINSFDRLLGGSNRDVWGVDGVYGVKTVDVPDIKKRPNWIHIDDWIKQTIEKRIEEFFDHNVTYSIDDLDIYARMSNQVNPEKINNKEVKTIMEILSDVYSRRNSENIQGTVNNWISRLAIEDLTEIGVDFDPKVVYNDGKELNEFIQKNYPNLDMLAYIADSFDKDRFYSFINEIY